MEGGPATDVEEVEGGEEGIRDSLLGEYGTRGAKVSRVGHEAGKGVGGGYGGDLVYVDSGDGDREGAGVWTTAEDGEEGNGGVGGAGWEARVSAAGEKVDLLARRAAIGSVEAEVARTVGGYVGAVGVGGDTGGGGVEE